MATQIAQKSEWKQGQNEDFMVYINRMEKVVDEIRNSGNLITFPVADGYACYEVVSRKPLTIRHIPCGDAWHIHAAHIRGLRLQDVEVQLEREEAYRKLFASKP